MKLLSLITALTAPLMITAQEVELADRLMENGKIYVVVVVIGIIVMGLYSFLFYLDNKLKKLEKEINAK
ncbi:MAG TPA: CcmD family protein [Flavobacteriales bacterium]|nr:CcmD family protein [Flavobacteriales bacterium]